MNFVEFTEILGNVGEFVGSLAVLATLIYLAVQARHSRELLEENRKITLGQVYQTRISFRIGVIERGTNFDFAETLVKFRNTKSSDIQERISELSEIQKEQLRNYFSMSIQVLDNSLYQGTLGLLDSQQLERTKSVILQNYPAWRAIDAAITPRVQQWYEDQEAHASVSSSGT